MLPNHCLAQAYERLFYCVKDIYSLAIFSTTSGFFFAENFVDPAEKVIAPAEKVIALAVFDVRL